MKQQFWPSELKGKLHGVSTNYGPATKLYINLEVKKFSGKT